ncbi:hypothetical protein E3N88_41376 [Mikania micrantha]|uniref:Uncharacterized protein n=1 Tax=Mikania micrantha TaxID=192012 RepID=A0A5N6LQD8_9ASTR|nr:hypothetical protein E3N88_41376 [Mikania micrantha]
MQTSIRTSSGSQDLGISWDNLLIPRTSFPTPFTGNTYNYSPFDTTSFGSSQETGISPQMAKEIIVLSVVRLLLMIMDYWFENGFGMELGVCLSLVTKRGQGPMVMVYRNSGGTVARAVATDPYICPIYMHISVYHGCVSD